MSRAFGAALLTLALLAGSVCASAKESPPPAVGEGLAADWEDVLLLDAFRHLRLSRTQLAAMLPLTRVVEEQTARFRRDNQRTLASITRAARKHRQALLRGERPPAAEQEGAIRYERTLRENRSAAESGVVAALAPRLARILTRQQAAAALLLARGEAPDGWAKSPALWDARSGFVLVGEQQDELRRAVMTKALARRYPADLIGAALRITPRLRLWSGGAVNTVTDQSESLVYLSTGFLCPLLQGHQTGRYPEAVRAALDRELQALQRRWKDPALLLPDASEGEVAAALEPLTRRLFLSPRFRPVLRERLGLEMEKEG